VSRAPRARIEAHGVPHGRIVGHGESAGAPRQRRDDPGQPGLTTNRVVKRPQGACIPRGVSRGGWIIAGVSRAPRARIEAHGIPHGRIVGHGESAGAPRQRRDDPA